LQIYTLQIADKTQIIVEDEDGEVVKTYELPSRPKKQEDPAVGAPVRQGVKRAGTWTGLGNKDKDKAADEQGHGESSKAGAYRHEAVRHGLSRMGTWGFGGKHTESGKNDKTAQQDESDDDRRIRFTIRGEGQRLTKEDFLKKLQSFDPKARCEVIEESDAPAAMKAMAKKDAHEDSPGSSRLFGAKDTQAAAGTEEAKSVGAEMAKRRGARVDDSDEDDRGREKRKAPVKKTEGSAGKSSTTMSSANKTSSGNEPESAAERKRRAGALRGVDDITDAQRGRSPVRDESVQPKQPKEPQETAAARRRRLAMEGSGQSTPRVQSPGIEGESAAERRRREAALGVSNDNNQDDSDDDDTPRVPPPVARSKGIRFAQSPVRGKK
jgi:hypothetical protein